MSLALWGKLWVGNIGQKAVKFFIYIMSFVQVPEYTRTILTQELSILYQCDCKLNFKMAGEKADFSFRIWAERANLSL